MTDVNTNFEQWKDHNKFRKGKPWYFMVGIALLAGAILGILYLIDDPFYVSQKKQNTAAFPVAFTQPEDDATTRTNINVWVDTSANMQGFIDLPRVGCIFSAYKMLLMDMERVLGRVSNSTYATPYQFKQGQSAKTTFSSLTDKNTYGTAISLDQNKQELLVALMQIAKDTTASPAIIFTDLEGSYDEDYQAKLKEAMQTLFEQGRSLRVDRFLSAYSGLISHYANRDLDVYYGREGDGRDGVFQVKVPVDSNHNQPRAFFMLTIASVDECTKIGDAVSSAYESYYQDPPQIKCGGHNHKLLNFKAHDTFSYNVIEHKTPVYLEAQEESGVTTALLGEGLSPEAADMPKADGVAGYSMLKQDYAVGTTDITFAVKPNIAGFGTAYAMQWVKPLKMEMYGITENHTKEYDITKDAQYLTARGDRYIKLTLDPLPADFEGFSIAPVGKPAQVSTVRFSIDRRLIAKGLYRINVPLTCKIDTYANLNKISYDEDLWIASADDIEEAARLIPQNGMVYSGVFSRTVKLNSFTSVIRDAYNTAEAADVLPVAQITFDLRVQ